MGVGQSLGGAAVPVCRQGGLGVCSRLGCQGLASPEWRTGVILHLLTCLCLAVIAAQLINISARWYLNECTADSLHILHTAVTCANVILFHTMAFWPGSVCVTFIFHASCGKQVAHPDTHSSSDHALQHWQQGAAFRRQGHWRPAFQASAVPKGPSWSEGVGCQPPAGLDLMH